MASSLTEIAYRTIQQGRSLAGLAHKELSTKAMELLAPDVVPSTEPVPDALIERTPALIKRSSGHRLAGV